MHAFSVCTCNKWRRLFVSKEKKLEHLKIFSVISCKVDNVSSKYCITLFLTSLSTGTATWQRGIRFPVGMVYLPSFMSFARDSKWGCRL